VTTHITNDTYDQLRSKLTDMKLIATLALAIEAIMASTRVIAGTDDNFYVPHANALVIAGKIPGAWLVQIKDAGHAVMDQYPDKINEVLQTFLSTTTANILSGESIQSYDIFRAQSISYLV
jgi:pimeloyl-ACP methyl ester carboxylesterase